MKGTHLYGLDGSSPLGFFAALGVQVAFETSNVRPKLWWSEGFSPHAIVEERFSVGSIAGQALYSFDGWKKSPDVNPSKPEGDSLDLSPEDIGTYLERAEQHFMRGGLATALLAEGGLTDSKGLSKPSPLCFTTGRQKFLAMAREILGAADISNVRRALEGPWVYGRKTPSFGWDVSDNREYAYMNKDPSVGKKPGPGAGVEALALLGLSLFPAFAGTKGKGTDTYAQGCSKKGRAGEFFSWPVWRKPAFIHAVRSLLSHAYDHPRAGAENRHHWYDGWGVSSVFRSPIFRKGKGYGNFGGSEVVWSS